MAIELLISVSLVGLYYADIISLVSVVLFGYIGYWLPKFLILDCFTEQFYPQILTRRVNKLYSCMSEDDKLVLVFSGAIFIHGYYLSLLFLIIYFSIRDRIGVFIKRKNKIALTFDDVPYGSHQRLIDVLDTHHTKATFFIIADYVTDDNKQCLIDAVKNGHQLGNHGKTNSAHWLCSKSELINEITTCDNLIREIYSSAGVELPKTMVYRPGCGMWTTQMLEIVSDLKYTLSLGSVYPNDSAIRSSLVNYLYLINHIGSGDVVILHDRKWTIPMMYRLIPWLKKNNYRTMTLEELFYKELSLSNI